MKDSFLQTFQISNKSKIFYTINRTKPSPKVQIGFSNRNTVNK